ncbi:MAG TPA: molybdopterin cofactor-binding domain-containing protein [Burkholderiales bacterium]|nr:molybdopterin cofactor-binding domain-containing protein [Burkholderiales bacterium]
MTTRREFLKISAGAGGGLMVGFHVPDFVTPAEAQTLSPEINAWVLVRPDERVIIRYARAEMGQGSMTSAAQLVAEELGCEWKRVTVEYADTNAQVRRKRVWGDMASVGSRTIRNSQEYLRKGGAQAREMLVAAAAQAWKVEPAKCKAAKGVITGPGKRKTTFGKVATAAAKMTPPADVALKDPKDWTIAGKPIARVEIPDIVTARIRYGIDAQLPGMAYAAVAQCPVFGGRVKSVDEAAIRGRRGVLKVLNMDEYVAVVADNWWRAKEALKALPVEWDYGPNASVTSETIKERLRAGLDADTDVVVAKQAGDVAAALQGAKVIEADYYTPYLAHVTMEPMGCTALVKEGRVDIWTSTQNAEASHAAAAATAGVPLENVYTHRTQLGGGFGRRGGAQDFVRQGVQIAKAMEGTPVKMLWTREEDMQHDFYRPASMIRFRAALDADGKPTALYSRVSAPSIIATLLHLPLKEGIDPQAVAAIADQPYQIANLRMEYAQRNSHVPVGFWRTVGHSQNPFMRESFIDELAHAAGKDPYEYRRRLLAESSRERKILDATAKHAKWDAKPPQGVHRGIAVTEGYGSYTSAVCELSVSDKNEVSIRRLVLGIDPGHAVNPDNILAQMQGSAVFMLSALFWGEITLKEGRVEQSNFDNHRVMRLAEMPKVELVLAPTGGFWGGIGEPGQASIGPAVCNAIFAATGKRVRSLPLKNEGFSLA